jgi:hypothetical protein
LGREPDHYLQFLLEEKFTKSLLQPLSPLALYSLVQAGWPVDAVFGTEVRAVNGL